MVRGTEMTHAEQVKQLEDASKILDQADVRKKEHYKEVFEKFLKHRDWSTDTYKGDYRDLHEEINGIENIIEDLQDTLERKKRQKKKEINEYDKHGRGVDDLESITLQAGKNPTLKQAAEKQEEIDEIRVKINIWKAFQSILDRVGRIKMYKVASSFETINEKANAQQNFEEYASEKVEEMRNELKEFTQREIKDRTHELEKAVEATRQEQKNMWTYFEKYGEAEKESLVKISRMWEQLTDVDTSTELDDLTGADGYGVDLEGDRREYREKKEERQAARDSATEVDIGTSNDADDGCKYELKGKSLEERKEVLKEMWEQEDILSMSQTEVEEMVDVSRQLIFDSGRILDSIEAAYEDGEFDGTGGWLKDFRN